MIIIIFYEKSCGFSCIRGVFLTAIKVQSVSEKATTTQYLLTQTMNLHPD